MGIREKKCIFVFIHIGDDDGGREGGKEGEAEYNNSIIIDFYFTIYEVLLNAH